jgi:hypothetical protein
MNKKEMNTLINDLSEESKEKVLTTVTFRLKNKQVNLDILSKKDYAYVLWLLEQKEDTEEKLKELTSIHNDLSNKLNEDVSVRQLLEKQEKILLEMHTGMNSSKKKLISTKEMEEIYGYGEQTQGQLRKRRKDPLPYEQLSKRGDIYYDVKKVDKWRENHEFNPL